MEKTNDLNYLNDLARMMLNRLEIGAPNSKQIEYAALILLNVDIVPEELRFETLLNQEEKEYFFWSINGYRQRQIAQIMRSDRETLRSYRNGIKEKYRSKTFTQALYKITKCCALQKNCEVIKDSLQDMAEGIILLVKDMN